MTTQLKFLAVLTCLTPIMSHFRMSIVVLTYVRYNSLNRTLYSLLKANYGSDIVDLNIYVDFHPSVEHENVLQISREFPWGQGKKYIHERTTNVGLLNQWLECWNPLHARHYGLIVEDDVELSPFYYQWLKNMTAYYNPEKFDQIYAISLQKQFGVIAKSGPRGKFPIVNGNYPYAYQNVGPWGLLVYPEKWLNFRGWYRSMVANVTFKPLIENMRSNSWYLSNPRAVWTPWMIKWAFTHDQYCVYSNLPNGLCLATNHREKGAHYRKYLGSDCLLVKTWMPELLFMNNKILYLNLSLLPSQSMGN